MKIFEIITAFVLILPLGIFLSFALMVAINGSMKLRKAEVLLRRLTGFYCFSASVSSFMLLSYYYMPDLFALLDMLFAISAIFSMVLFYHFFHYTIKPGVKFSPLHYIFPSLLFIILLVVKIVMPEIWVQEGVRASLIAALLFGIAYSLLPLVGMQRYYTEQTVLKGEPNSINNSQVVMYVVEVILFPVVFVFFPLVGGQSPGVLIASMQMISIILALRANIPFTYAIIRHYTSYETQHRSMFDEISVREISVPTEETIYRSDKRTEDDISEQKSDSTPKKATKSRKQPKKNLPPGFDKKMFNDFMRSRKPYLKPDLTINDVAQVLESNRTYISEFVNRAYKMNFSSYISLCRLREMNRLLELPKNKGRVPRELIPLTGFGTMRNYLRARQRFAKQAENKEGEESENN